MWNVRNKYTPLPVKDRYTIGEIKEKFGIGADSLRYYEEKGLIHPKRGSNQYRYYDTREFFKLNIIRSLRDIDISVDRIGQLLQNRTVKTTLEMLNETLKIMDERIAVAEKYRAEILTQIREIETASGFLCDVVTVSNLPERPAFVLEQSYITNGEYDIVRRKLAKDCDLPFSVIGDSRIGSAISLQRVMEGDYCTYDCVFMLNEKGSFRIPGGLYLTIRYRGLVQSEKYIRILTEYAERNHYKIIGPFIEFVSLDIHTTDDINEAVTENQVLVEV